MGHREWPVVAGGRQTVRHLARHALMGHVTISFFLRDMVKLQQVEDSRPEAVDMPALLSA